MDLKLQLTAFQRDFEKLTRERDNGAAHRFFFRHRPEDLRGSPQTLGVLSTGFLVSPYHLAKHFRVDVAVYE